MQKQGSRSSAAHTHTLVCKRTTTHTHKLSHVATTFTINNNYNLIFLSHICPSVHLFICLSVHLFICLPLYLSVQLFIYLPVYLSVHLLIYLPVYLSVHLFICLLICPFTLMQTCMHAHTHSLESLNTLTQPNI
ncbi:hypothetical protein DPEC_G00137430 [Dallia pectoralis]|uniref:Uncharacterized protein n=1 Tax=Dallia pectoralis TaxID=75939 RepID=A0ACC2GLJ7_DALPE|nr:hypothetical protein DPEC_G00137430 [Dallia pectoralis]